MAGAALGALAGLFFGLPGLIIGQFAAGVRRICYQSHRYLIADLAS